MATKNELVANEPLDHQHGEGPNCQEDERFQVRVDRSTCSLLCSLIYQPTNATMAQKKKKKEAKSK